MLASSLKLAYIINSWLQQIHTIKGVKTYEITKKTNLVKGW